MLAESERLWKSGVSGECTPYWWARQISLDRNEVMHEAAGGFNTKTAALTNSRQTGLCGLPSRG